MEITARQTVPPHKEHCAEGRICIDSDLDNPLDIILDDDTIEALIESLRTGKRADKGSCKITRDGDGHLIINQKNSQFVYEIGMTNQEKTDFLEFAERQEVRQEVEK